MKLDFEGAELDRLAEALSAKLAVKLKPLLSNKDGGTSGDRILSVDDLSKYLSVDKSWVYHNIRQIPHFKIGRFPRFRKREVDKWLEQHKAPIFNELQRKFIPR